MSNTTTTNTLAEASPILPKLDFLNGFTSNNSVLKTIEAFPVNDEEDVVILTLHNSPVGLGSSSNMVMSNIQTQHQKTIRCVVYTEDGIYASGCKKCKKCTDVTLLIESNNEQNVSFKAKRGKLYHITLNTDNKTSCYFYGCDTGEESDNTDVNSGSTDEINYDQLREAALNV